MPPPIYMWVSLTKSSMIVKQEQHPSSGRYRTHAPNHKVPSVTAGLLGYYALLQYVPPLLVSATARTRSQRPDNVQPLNPFPNIAHPPSDCSGFSRVHWRN